MFLLKEKHHLPDDAEQMHLCYLGDDGYQAEDSRVYRKLTRHPTHVCKHCGRKAHEACNLCQPEQIESF
ncbi:MAG: hypothetical protein ACYSUT_11465 [Planctomycetota bacterium]|jgi:hypothetical protein